MHTIPTRRIPRIPLLHSLWFAIPATLLVEASNAGLNSLTHSDWGDTLTVVYFAAYGLYCLQNYLWTPPPEPESPSRRGGPAAVGETERRAASRGLDAGRAAVPRRA